MWFPTTEERLPRKSTPSVHNPAVQRYLLSMYGDVAEAGGCLGLSGEQSYSLPLSLQPLQSHAQPHATCLQWPAAAGLSPHRCLVGTGRAVLGSRGREGSRAGGSIFAQLHLSCPAGIAAAWRDGSRGSTQQPCVLIALPIQGFTGRESDFSPRGCWSDMHPDSPSTAIRHKPETWDLCFS